VSTAVSSHPSGLAAAHIAAAELDLKAPQPTELLYAQALTAFRRRRRGAQ
jgi:hypothetical protein